MTCQKEGYTDTENDLDQLIEIINETDLTKSAIKSELKDHRLFEYMDFNSDTISLDRVSLVVLQSFVDIKVKYLIYTLTLHRVFFL